MSISKIKVGSTEHDLQASKLTTARTIGLGTGATGTATSFDGSANITIPVTSVKEAYLAWGGKDISGSFSALDAALIEDLSANRLAGLPASKVTFERSSDGGSTWATYSGNAALVTTEGSASNANTTSSKSINNWHRITIDVNGSIYCELRKIAIFLNTDGATGCKCKVEWGDYSTTTVWTTEKTVSVAGWSGWNIINVSKRIGNSIYDKIRYIRLTFSQTSVDSNYTSNLNVSKIRFYSNNCWVQPTNLAKNGHVYNYDSYLNVTFPAKVTATSFVEGDTALSSKYAAKSHKHSVTAAGTNSSTSITPAGTVSQPTFTGTAASHNHTFTGTAAEHNHTFTGTQATTSVKYTPAGTVSSSFTGTAHNHTFSGTAATSGKPDTTNVTTIYSITGVGTLPSASLSSGTLPSCSYTAPSLSASVSNQCLTISLSGGSHSFSAGAFPTLTFSAGTLPTREAVSMPNTNHTHSVTATGTIGNATAGGSVSSTFTGTEATISHTFTPAGSISKTSITPAGTISSKELTPAGTVSRPTFTGTCANHNHAFTGSAVNSSTES